MVNIRPFAAIHYARQGEMDLSKLIAPPYDVLDEKDKRLLQSKHPNNIVTVDLPFMPPKSVGPDEVYEKANMTLAAWLSAGVLERDHRPALYPYCQNYEHGYYTAYRHLAEQDLDVVVRLGIVDHPFEPFFESDARAKARISTAEEAGIRTFHPPSFGLGRIGNQIRPPPRQPIGRPW